jgi:4-oxalocrotonate tautomerase
MPPVIVKLWPCKSEKQKADLADAISRDVMSTLGNVEESVSVGFEEVDAASWRDKVWKPDIITRGSTLYKSPATACDRKSAASGQFGTAVGA